MPTREQLIENIKAMETQGAQPDEIQSYLDSFKGKQPSGIVSPQPMDISLGEKVGSFLAPTVTQTVKKIADREMPTGRDVLGSALEAGSFLVPGGAIAKGALKTAGLAKKALTGAKTLGVAGGMAGAGREVGAGGDVGDIAEATIGGATIGAGVGVALPVLGAGAIAAPGAIKALPKVIEKVTPKLLSYTSDVPEKAFETMLARREPVTRALREGVTPEIALSETQSAVRQLRTTLSKDWEDSTKNIYDEFTTKRWGMATNAQKLANKVADDFGIELPQNLGNISVKESLDLLKEVNELYSKRAVKESAQGIGVRKFKEYLQSSVIKNFGGEKGSVSTLYSNYSAKKGVLDAANDIVKAYSTGKPIQQSTALGRLKALFNENKSAYLDAILDLEKATGKDLMSKITAVQFSEKLPKKLASVSSSGGLQSPKGVIDKALDLMILPLSSPRSAAFIARALTKVKKVGTSTEGRTTPQ